MVRSITLTHCAPRVIDTGGPARGERLEPRVARLESDVAHLRADVSAIKTTLDRLAPRIDEMYGFLTAKLPELATKAELIDLRAETKAEITELRTSTKADFMAFRTETKTDIAELRTETKTDIAELRSEMAKLWIQILQRPTRRQSVLDTFGIVSLIGVILTIAGRFAH